MAEDFNDDVVRRLLAQADEIPASAPGPRVARNPQEKNWEAIAAMIFVGFVVLAPFGVTMANRSLEHARAGRATNGRLARIARTAGWVVTTAVVAALLVALGGSN